MKNRNRNGEIWEFEMQGIESESKVVLGLDGGTTSTVCVCIPFSNSVEPLAPPIPVLSRAIAGCSNHNSYGRCTF